MRKIKEKIKKVTVGQFLETTFKTLSLALVVALTACFAILISK